MARTKHVARTLFGAGLVSLIAVTAAQTGSAAWPLPESGTSADAKDPVNWPNDPEYGYKASAVKAERRSGAWNFYGFQPDRSEGAQPLRAAEVGKPVGMSVDLAWRYTTGNPRVLISILDSGPRWHARDIINKAYINVGELAKHKPRQKDGKPCAGKGDFPEFDCNGDGVVSYKDWTDDPGLLPEASSGHPKGDKNNNGMLDPGDLILNFSDGVDDDGNGYTDDICGWDFLMDDNDPFEDTDFYHGTNQAGFAAAETNNGEGEAGMCPECRFVPLRVGDSFIADSNDFGQAVVYSADNGVSAIECALGTINLSPYAQRAVEYAWHKGAIVTGSMADENSKHHNLPNTANYVFSAHAIINNGPDSTSADSFLIFDPGTNYGGNNYISSSSEAASSGAAGVNSGIVGLMQSAAMKYGKYPLSAGEILELFIMTADDINVPESQQAKAKYYWSQPGFDQRFGYGRTNVNTAIEWIKEGKIPPEVNVTEPLWFENLYPERQSGPVKLEATVSAKRATTYDYVVEWAPGVQPLDHLFKKITEKSGVPGATVSGASEPLALIDLATIDPTHEPDPDSKRGENQHAFTVRIRAVAHYDGGVGDVPGEYRRTYYKQSDPALLPGFPIKLRASLESSPKLADIDGDGVREILQGDAGGRLHVYKITPSGPQELPGFPLLSKRLDGLDPKPDNPGGAYLAAKGYQAGNVDPDLGREGFMASPAIADLDGDGKLEIVATTLGGTIYVVQADGSPKAGFPVRLPYVPSCPLDPTVKRPDVCMDKKNIVVRGAMASPVLIDMNKDGKLDIVQAGYDGFIHVFDATGKALPNWPIQLRYDGRLTTNEERNRILTTPAVADLNGDGIPEILTGSSEKLGSDEGSGAFYLLDGRGKDVPGFDAARPAVMTNWPLTTTSINVLPLLGEGTTTSGVFADIDGDGVSEAVFHGNSSPPMIVPTDPGVQDKLNKNPPNLLPKKPEGAPKGLSTAVFGEFSKAENDTMFPLFSHPSIGDLDLDGTPDVVAAGGSLSLIGYMTNKRGTTARAPQFLVSMWSGKTGDMMAGSPVNMEDFMFVNSQAIADLTGDGYPEVISGSGGYLVRAFDACGREAKGFPKNTGQWVLATTAVGDVDGDAKLDVVVGTRDGWLFAWKTDGDAQGVVQWESWHHDNQNTGNYATKLTQGVLKKDVGPLVCSTGAGGGAGAGGAAGGGGAAGASGGTAIGAAPGGATESEGGCGCEVPATGGRASASLSALALAGLAALRRRRRA